MNIRLCFYIVGTFLKFLGLILIVPLACSLIYQDGDQFAFLLTAAIIIIAGFLLREVNKKSQNINEINRKEAFLIAFLCWIAACLFGSLPYLLIPVFTSPIDTLFESVAGFTTTGSSVIDNIETQPHGILFYRSFTQWLGGMGIIVAPNHSFADSN